MKAAVRPKSLGRPLLQRPPTQPAIPFPVFIAYSDIPAARHAMAQVSKLLHTGKPARRYAVQPMLWRFDQLNDPRWRDTALTDAGRASTVVLALRDGATLGQTTETWLSALTLRQRGAPITALVLLGDDEAWTITLQPSQRPAPAVSASQVARTTPTIVTLPRKESACAA